MSSKTIVTFIFIDKVLKPTILYPNITWVLVCFSTTLTVYLCLLFTSRHQILAKREFLQTAFVPFTKLIPFLYLNLPFFFLTSCQEKWVFLMDVFTNTINSFPAQLFLFNRGINK